jgi:hypothetical protein
MWDSFAHPVRGVAAMVEWSGKLRAIDMLIPPHGSYPPERREVTGAPDERYK